MCSIPTTMKLVCRPVRFPRRTLRGDSTRNPGRQGSNPHLPASRKVSRDGPPWPGLRRTIPCAADDRGLVGHRGFDIDEDVGDLRTQGANRRERNHDDQSEHDRVLGRRRTLFIPNERLHQILYTLHFQLLIPHAADPHRPLLRPNARPRHAIDPGHLYPCPAPT